MRILMANNYYYLRGGSERVMFTEMETLRAMGHEVAIFSCDHPDNIRDSNSKYFLSNKDFETVSAGRKLGLAFQFIYSSEARRKIESYFRDFKPDILHCHNIYGRLTTTILDAAKKAGIPSVVTLHDYKLACPSYLMLNHGKPCQLCVGGNFYHCLRTKCHKESRAVSLVSTMESYYNQWFTEWYQADFLICPSRFLLEIVRKHGYPKEMLVHLPNGLDPDKFKPEFRSPGFCVYIGRLSREKGLLTLLESALEAGSPLRIIGDGPLRPELERKIKASGAAHITLEGYKTGLELETLVSQAAFVITPSEWYENCSMTVLEAMAFGKPVIASNIGGLPEQVKDGETGIVFKPGDAGMLTKAIQTLNNDNDLRVRLGKAARKRFLDIYSLEQHCNRLVELYKLALSNKE